VSPDVQREIRKAFLDAQSRWLENAENATTATERAIAMTIADAFSQEAYRFKNYGEEQLGEPVPGIEP
jgi:hypothetical protein